MAEAWTATKKATGTWFFEWTGVSGVTYSIWLDGNLLDTVADIGEYECLESDYNDAPPPLEIVSDESGEIADNDIYPPYAILQWREVDGANGYVVEKLVSGDWIIVREIADASVGWYTYTSQPLTDGTATSFRVKAEDVNGNDGTPVNLIITIVRNPAPPDVAITIDGSGDVRVGAA